MKFLHILALLGMLALLGGIVSAGRQKHKRGTVKAMKFKSHGPDIAGASGHGNRSRQHFGETRLFDVENERHEKKTMKLHKFNIKNEHFIGSKKTVTYGNENMLVNVECAETSAGEECEEFALMRVDKETLFVTKEKALVIPNNGGDVSFIDPKKRIEAVMANNDIPDKRRRKRAVLLDTLTNTRVVKMLMFADEGLVQVFMTLYDDNLTAAKNGIIHYLTLLCNEMTMHYQSLRVYGVAMMVDGVEMDMDIAIGLRGVEFPPGNTPTSNFVWSDRNEINGDIFTVTTYNTDSSVTYSGLLSDFSDYIETLTTSTVFDHAMAVTGYDLYSTTNYADGSSTSGNLLGQAWVGTLCNYWSTQSGTHTSINEFAGGLAETASHELGHGIGISHDVNHEDSSCPNSVYLMSTHGFSPSSDTVDTYSKFSICSANDIRDYTNSISSYWLDTCLRATDEIFVINFCLGLPGHHATLDEQCARSYGVGSVRLSHSDTTMESHLLAGYVSVCVATADYEDYPMDCSVPDRPGYYYYKSSVSPGTNCLKDGVADPNNICYHGRCESSLVICEREEQSTTTTTTPTTTTTSPTTTTTSPTTTSTSPTTTTTSPTTTTTSPTTTTTSPTTTTTSPTTTTTSPTTTTTSPTTTTTSPTTTTTSPTTTTTSPTTTTTSPTTTTTSPTTTTTTSPTTTTTSPTTTTTSPTTTTTSPTTTTTSPTTTTTSPTTTTTSPTTTTTSPTTTTTSPTTTSPTTTTASPTTTTTSPTTTTTSPTTTSTTSSSTPSTTTAPLFIYERRCQCNTVECCRTKRKISGKCCRRCKPDRKEPGQCKLRRRFQT